MKEPAAEVAVDPATAALAPFLGPLAAFGQAGLLREYIQYDTFGRIESRVVAGRITQQLEPLLPPDTNFSSDVMFLPLSGNVIHPLTLIGGRPLYLRGNALRIDRNESETEAETDILIQRLDAAFLYSPTDWSMFSAGVYYEDANIKVRPISGGIDSAGFGGRVDGLLLLPYGFGLSARLDWGRLDEDYKNFGPTPYSQYRDRTYFESVLSRPIPVWGQSLAVRPEVSFAWLRNIFEDVPEAPGWEENYSQVGAGVRVEGAIGDGGRVRPFLALNYDYQIRNSVDGVIEDPNSFGVQAGASVELAPGNIFNISIGQLKGLEDEREETLFLLNGAFTF